MPFLLRLNLQIRRLYFVVSKGFRTQNFPASKILKKHLTFSSYNAIILKHSLGGIAQLVERLICIQEVLGSNPCISTTRADYGLLVKL